MGLVTCNDDEAILLGSELMSTVFFEPIFLMIYPLMVSDSMCGTYLRYSVLMYISNGGHNYVKPFC